MEIGKPELDRDNLPQVQDMVSMCAGLVIVDEKGGIIRLVHYTTQEYFQRRTKRWFPEAETEITETCVFYLSLDTFKSGYCKTDSEFEERLQLNQLYDYAAHHWSHHARAASNSSHGVTKFLRKQAQVEASSQALIAVMQGSGHSRYSQEIPKQMTGLHLAAYFGVYNAVKLLIGSENPNPEDTYDRTPISWAAAR